MIVGDASSDKISVIDKFAGKSSTTRASKQLLSVGLDYIEVRYVPPPELAVLDEL